MEENDNSWWVNGASLEDAYNKVGEALLGTKYNSKILSISNEKKYLDALGDYFQYIIPYSLAELEYRQDEGLSEYAEISCTEPEAFDKVKNYYEIDGIKVATNKVVEEYFRIVEMLFNTLWSGEIVHLTRDNIGNAVRAPQETWVLDKGMIFNHDEREIVSLTNANYLVSFSESKAKLRDKTSDTINEWEIRIESTSLKEFCTALTRERAAKTPKNAGTKPKIPWEQEFNEILINICDKKNWAASKLKADCIREFLEGIKSSSFYLNATPKEQHDIFPEESTVRKQITKLEKQNKILSWK